MTVKIILGDSREKLREIETGSVHCCITSPPYFGLRDYGVEGQMGLEATPAEFVAGMVDLFREVRRVLRDDGTLWLNLGDSYAGSWGAQSRGEATGEGSARIQGTSPLQARSIAAHVRGTTHVGSLKNTPGLKPKDLIGIPWRVALALQEDGWWLRQDIIWSKPNPMPESVKDRCTKAHEYLFLLSKSERYHYDHDAIAENAEFSEPNSPQSIKSPMGQGYTRRARGIPPRHEKYAESSDQSRLDRVGRGGRRNKRSVWTVSTKPFKQAHFATFPPDLIEPCVLAGCPKGGTILDPFGGAGTTGMVAERLGRNATLIELNPEYAAMASDRLRGELCRVDTDIAGVDDDGGPLFATSSNTQTGDAA